VLDIISPVNDCVEPPKVLLGENLGQPPSLLGRTQAAVLVACIGNPDPGGMKV